MPAVEACPVFVAEERVFPMCERTVDSPSIIVGVTHPQTCLVLTGRLRKLREAGFRVTLVSSPGTLLDTTAASEGVEAVAVPMERRIAPLADLVSLVRLWRLLHRRRPDMVEFSTPKAGLLGTLAAALCGVPQRIYMLRGLKLERTRGLKRQVLWVAERVASACAHRVLCNSASLRTKALALRLAPERKLQILGQGSSNGVDTGKFLPGQSDVRRRLGIPPEAFVPGFVGRLTRDKGLPELVCAFDQILRAEPFTHLLLVGWFDDSEDSLDRIMQSRIERHPRIHLTGFVEDTAEYYRAMDVMVLPTWREGFPNSVLEAAATAVPVITTYSTGSRDSVVPEVTGLLIPPGCPEAISEAVLKLLRDPERRLRMGRASRAWAMEHYSNEQVLGMTVDYYKCLLGSAAAERLARKA